MSRSRIPPTPILRIPNHRTPVFGTVFTEAGHRYGHRHTGEHPWVDAARLGELDGGLGDEPGRRKSRVPGDGYRWLLRRPAPQRPPGRWPPHVLQLSEVSDTGTAVVMLLFVCFFGEIDLSCILFFVIGIPKKQILYLYAYAYHVPSSGVTTLFCWRVEECGTAASPAEKCITPNGV